MRVIRLHMMNRNRQERINTIRQNPNFPVLIIGAGVNGIGTFRELALQGLAVLLVDRGDFCSGASAASSHMIHGGIRYLENGEFRLVKEAVRERNRLLQNAPHLTRPLPTNIPIFTRFSGLLNAPLKFLKLKDKPGERGALVIKLGLRMYDAYAGKQQTVPQHSFVGRKEALAKYPKLNSDIRYLATYYDGVMPSPERICIEMLTDAEKAHAGAVGLNYMTAVSITNNTVNLRDEVTGEIIPIKPKIVINAAGPWVDLTNASLGQPTQLMGGTKGAHIVVDNPELKAALSGHEFFFENDDGRIVLMLPIFGRVLIGTSDIRIGNPDEAVCTDKEVAYFIELTHKIFPTIPVTPEQIVFRFAGVRPLPASDANSAGQISRDHHNHLIEPAESGLDFPIMNLIGGKWTTFRAFSEQVADEVLARLGEGRIVDTKDLPIGGGKDYPVTAVGQEKWITAVAEENHLSEERVQTLFNRYGTHAAEVARFMTKSADKPLIHSPVYTVREVRFIAQTEQVVHLDDFLLRRSLLAMRGDVTGDLLTELVTVFGDTFNWTSQKRQSEFERVIHLFRQRHRLEIG